MRPGDQELLETSASTLAASLDEVRELAAKASPAVRHLLEEEAARLERALARLREADELDNWPIEIMAT